MTAPSPAEDRFPITVFDSVRAKNGQIKILSLGELSDLMQSTTAAKKDALPLLKLARFGNRKSPKGSFRHDANIEEIFGVEVEYDGEEYSFDEAIAKLRAAGIRCLAYTTPSHTSERPRWRVIAPTSRPLPPQERYRLASRLNGVLNGILSSESFALSQIFYFGRVDGVQDYRVELELTGNFIDLCDNFDAGAIGKATDSRSVVASQAKDLEAYIKTEINWMIVFQCLNLDELERHEPELSDRLRCDLAREGNLGIRWNGGTAGLTDKSRSARDRSIVQILRSMGYSPTEAITCAAAWGGSNPNFGRGLVCTDRNGRDVDIERYWIRCWMRNGDSVPLPAEQLPPSFPIADRHAKNPFPEECRDAPGAVGDLIRYFSRGMTRHVPEELLVVMALATIAHSSQNRFVAGPTHASLQVYAAIVANTGVGKTELAKLLSKLLEGSAAEQGIVESVASGPALLKRFHKLASKAVYGPTLLYLMDELGLKLQARTGRSANTHAKDMVDECISLYGRGNSRYAGKAYADTKNDIEPIDRPNLSVVGFTTPAPLIEALTGTDAATGLINRFLLAMAEGDMPMKMLREVDPTPCAKLVQFMQRIGDRDFCEPASGDHAALHNGLTKHASRIRSTFLSFEEEAERRIDDITVELNSLAHGSDEITNSIWGRGRQQVIVVAAILAISEIKTDLDDLQAPAITLKHVNWAWQFVRWSTQNWVMMFKSMISGSDEEAAMNAIRNLLTNVADYAPGGRLSHRAEYGNSRSNSATCAKGWMPLSLISRELRRLPGDVKKRALSALLENEEIEGVNVDRSSGDGGRSATAYRLVL